MAFLNINATLPEKGRYGTGLVFLPHDAAQRDDLIARFEALVRDEDQVVLGWRDVPTDDSTLGDSARRAQPVFRQIFVGIGSAGKRSRDDGRESVADQGSAARCEADSSASMPGARP